MTITCDEKTKIGEIIKSPFTGKSYKIISKPKYVKSGDNDTCDNYSYYSAECEIVSDK